MKLFLPCLRYFHLQIEQECILVGRVSSALMVISTGVGCGEGGLGGLPRGVSRGRVCVHVGVCPGVCICVRVPTFFYPITFPDFLRLFPDFFLVLTKTF